MQRWKPAPSAGSLVGILAFLLCAGGGGGLVARNLVEGTGTGTLSIVTWAFVAVLALLALAVSILLWGYFTLSYTLEEADGGALIIRWAWRRIRLPLAEIEYLGPARQILGAVPTRRLWPWPGYYLNTITDVALGKVKQFASAPPRRQVLVCTARGSFGISPDRPAAFAARFAALNETVDGEEQLIQERPLATLPSLPTPAPINAIDDDEELGYSIVAASSQRAFREETADRPIALFADRPAVGLILLGGALVAAMLWFILLRFDAVPQTLPLHYNTTGQPDRIGTPREIFLFPLITALVAIANLALAWSVIRFDRFAARLLLGGTCLVQTVAWVALLKIF